VKAVAADLMVALMTAPPLRRTRRIVAGSTLNPQFASTFVLRTLPPIVVWSCYHSVEHKVVEHPRVPFTAKLPPALPLAAVLVPVSELLP